MDRVQGPSLRNLTVEALGKRLWAIEKNIQFLDSSLLVSKTTRDHEGWTSFAWWLRARHWTLMEINHRNLKVDPSPIVVEGLTLDQSIHDLTLGDTGILARVGQAKYLKPFLHGELRFTPASSYNDSKLGTARADDEMRKSRMRPGQEIRIVLEDGTPIQAIGDVSFSKVRAVEINGALAERPYLFCSFSNEVDPRLIAEFSNADAILVMTDVDEFMRRSIGHLNAVVPNTRKGLVPNDYFDPYYHDRDKLGAIRSKEMDYAFQREVRFVIDPGEDIGLAAAVLTTKTRSFADIAGLYDVDGKLIDGSGPPRLFQM